MTTMKDLTKTTFILVLLISLAALTGCTPATKKPTPISKTISDVNSIPSETIEPAIEIKPSKNQHGLTEKIESTSSTTISNIQTGRYSSIRPKPDPAQIDLLQVIIRVTIPEEIRTIGQTIPYLLKRSGYHLVPQHAEQSELAAFFNKPLPRVHRHIGPMTLEDALKILTAPTFILYKDAVQRQISYELDPYYVGDEL